MTDNHKLFVTGCSQGGFVAMAAQRAMNFTLIFGTPNLVNNTYRLGYLRDAQAALTEAFRASQRDYPPYHPLTRSDRR